MSLVRFAFLLWLGWSWWVATVQAQAEPAPLTAVVRVIDTRDALLLERVRGQTSDLDVELSTQTSEALEPTLGAQLDTARVITAQEHARVVVWFVHEEDALTVFVAEPGVGRVLVRRLDHGRGELAASAQQEAAALVVRTAMKALAQGGEIGVAEREVAAPPPPEPPPPPTVVVRPPEPLPEGIELVQFLGERAAWDSISKYGQHGLFGRLALRSRAFQAELRGSLGWPSSLDDSVARVKLLRHALSLHAAYVPYASDTWIVSAAVGGGMNLFLTSVSARNGSLESHDESLVSVVASADLTVRVMPSWAHRRVGFALLLGADVLPAAPVIGYDDANGSFVRRDRLWNVLPTAALELVLRMK